MKYQEILKEETERLSSYRWCSEEYIKTEAAKEAKRRIKYANRRIINKVFRANQKDPHCPRIPGKPSVNIYNDKGHLDTYASVASEKELAKIWHNWDAVKSYAKENNFELIAESNLGKYI